MTELSAVYADLNARLFDGALVASEIRLHVLADDRCLAATLRPGGRVFCKSGPALEGIVLERRPESGGPPVVVVDRRLLDGTHPMLALGNDPLGLKRCVADVLLHEMIHVALEEAGVSEGGLRTHGKPFAQQANAIGQVLGLGRVRAHRARAERELPSCALWPDVVRPEGYYLGTVLAPPRTAAWLRKQRRAAA